ncbi:MAG: alpha/beta hydrolase [Thermoguttaceae bacterium]
MSLLRIRRRTLAVSVLLAAVVAICANPLLADPAATEPPEKTKTTEKDRPSEKPVLSAKTVVRADVPYGKDPLQRLDVYAPRDAQDAPIVVFFHRGEWSKGDKSEAAYKPKFLNDNGVVFVSANYRLSPAAKHPAHINDVASAVRWVYDHAAEFGGSREKIVVMGHSAGCHLVTLLALDPRYLAGVKLRPSDLRGVVAWSGGAYDLVAKVKAGGMYGPYIKSAFGDSQAAWRDASPVAHVGDAKSLPPFLFISVVDRGKTDSKLAAENLAQLIRNAKGQAKTKLIEGRTHMTVNALLGAANDTTGGILLDFVREVTR